MSFHFWRNSGQPRKTRFITLANSYHGETLGALAVGNVDLYKSIYRPLLMDVITVPSPDSFVREAGVSEADHARLMFAHMEAALARTPRRSGRGHRRAAGAVRRRHAHVRPACISSCCARPATGTACT